MRDKLSRFWVLLKKSAVSWNEHNALRLGASLSFYGIFSLSPLLMIIAGITVVLFGKDAMRGELSAQLAGLMGQDGAKMAQLLIANTHRHSSGLVPTMVGLITLLIGATSAFAELESSLNLIWGATPKKVSGIRQFVENRLLTFVLVAGIELLLMVSLVANTLLSASSSLILPRFPLQAALFRIFYSIFSIGMLTLLFGLMFKILPQRKVLWRDVWIGSFVTAVLFSIGKFIIGAFLVNSAVTSGFGASATLMVIMLWIYYTSLIMFYGAEFTKVVADTHSPNVIGMGKRHPLRNITLSVLFILVTLRVVLPVELQRYVNYVLNQEPGYRGHFGSVRIHLWRGAYSINGIRIDKVDNDVPVHFFETNRLDISIAWHQLLRRQVLAKILLVDPKVNFVDGKKKDHQQYGKDASWDDMLKELAPFRITELDIQNGEIHLRNYESDPPVNIYVNEIKATLENLTNSERLTKDMYAHLIATGRTLGDGKVELDLSVDPTASKSTFSYRGKLLDFQLPALSPFFKKYGGFTFKKGEGSIITEVTVKDNKISGYIKPLFRHIQIFSLKKELKEHDSIFTIIWEAALGAAVDIFKNHPKDQFATLIPIHGELKSPKTDVIPIIGGVLKNEFIKAFTAFYEKPSKFD